MTDKIKVVICGALGKMGLETVRAVQNDEDLELVGLMDLRGGSGDLALEIGLGMALPLDIDLEVMLTTARPQVMIDFTNPQSVYSNTLTAISLGINCVVGTTGLSETELKQVEEAARQKGV